MKALVLLLVLASTSLATAAPKRAVWEYASLDLAIIRSVGATNQMNVYGVQLHLPGRKPLFLRSTQANFDSTAYKNYLLNKLGTQGWELVGVMSNRGVESKYIFKRQK